MRCFISIELPKEVTAEIKNIQSDLESKNLFHGSFAKEENLHLTLKFLGEISNAQIEKVKLLLNEIKLRKFKASLGSLGIFNTKTPRIFWISINAQEIHDLKKEIDETLSKVFPKEKMEFASHVTIARIKGLEHRQKLLDYPTKNKTKKIEFFIDKFWLKESTLTPDGPFYKTIEEFTLN